MTDEKSRHGLLTAFLILMIVANAISVIIWALQSKMIYTKFPDISKLTVPVLILLALINIVCLIALFKWKKWGFWVLCATSIIAPVMNVVLGLGFAQSARNIIGVLILYALLQIGKKKKGWPQLD